MEQIDNNDIILGYLRDRMSLLEQNYLDNQDPSNYHSLRFVKKEYNRYIEIINRRHQY